MDGAELFPGKSDAQVEAELAQATRQLEMLKATGALTGGVAGAAAATSATAAPAADEDCARTQPSFTECCSRMVSGARLEQQYCRTYLCHHV